MTLSSAAAARHTQLLHHPLSSRYHQPHPLAAPCNRSSLQADAFGSMPSASHHYLPAAMRLRRLLRPACPRRFFSSSSSPSPSIYPPPASPSTFPRISIAPMVDVTDTHFRTLIRLLSSTAHLYIPMIPDIAAIARPSLLHSPPTHSLHLQLAGSSLSSLLLATSLLPHPSPYSSINLNVGCPASSAQHGHWGAALLTDPTYPTTLHHLHSSLSSSPSSPSPSIPLSIKCRIGLTDPPDYPTFSRFIHRMRRTAHIRHFIVHCRPALLHLSTTHNLHIPPLDHSFAHRIKAEHGADIDVEVNGGVDGEDKVRAWMATDVDGLMIGRWAYKAVWDMRHIDRWVREWKRVRRRMGRGRGEEGEAAVEEEEWDEAEGDVVCRYAVLERYCEYVAGVDGRRLGNDVGRLLRPLQSLWVGECGCKEWRKQLQAGVSDGLSAVDAIRRAMDVVEQVRRAADVRDMPRTFLTALPTLRVARADAPEEGGARMQASAG